MAELATIARPYAEALFKTAANAELSAQLQALAAVAADEQLRRFADNPKVQAKQIFDVMADVVGRKGVALGKEAQNLLRTVIDNGRVGALPEIAAQYHALVNAKNHAADATIYSAFPMDAAQTDALMVTLAPRFGGRKLHASVVVQPELIGGVRVVVGDEVLDTSIRARLESMKAALTA
jgi:F-type H+-transporting ATPase subunit delta